jgi:signal transduction histidine kinase
VQSELREGEVALVGDAELLRVALEYVAGLAILRSRGRAVRIGLARGVAGAPAITIADEGGPVAPDLLARLFEPFVERAAIPAEIAAPASPSGQGGAASAPGPRRRERLGLGLAIASGILTAHGGSLAVELASPEGQAGVAPVGLRFTCALGSGAEAGGQDHV